MKRNILISLVLFYFTPFFAQTKSEIRFYKKSATKQAETMIGFLIKKEYTSYVNYLYPKALKKLGVEGKMIDGLEKMQKRQNLKV